MNVLIKIAELWLWLTVVLYLWWALLQVFDLWAFDIFQNVIDFLTVLIWYNNISVFLKIMWWILIVYCGRWIISWASNNWWQTPNNRWN